MFEESCSSVVYKSIAHHAIKLPLSFTVCPADSASWRMPCGAAVTKSPSELSAGLWKYSRGLSAPQHGSWPGRLAIQSF